MLLLLRVWVQSLVGELRSNKLCGEAKKQKKSPEIPGYSTFPEVELNLLHLSVDWTRQLASNKQNKAEVIMSDI